VRIRCWSCLSFSSQPSGIFCPHLRPHALLSFIAAIHPHSQSLLQFTQSNTAESRLFHRMTSGRYPPPLHSPLPSLSSTFPIRLPHIRFLVSLCHGHPPNFPFQCLRHQNLKTSLRIIRSKLETHCIGT
jgi:hypothetical protein